MDLFGRKKDIPQIKSKTKESQHPLVAEFHRAAYGNACRSRAMKSDLGEIWLKAVAPLSTDQWTILRMTRAPFILPAGQDMVNTPAWKTRVEAEGLNFFEAIEHLAYFENGASGLSYEPTGLSKEDLGLEHYEAFAVREAIAFHAEDGMPHPTAYGEVVTTGTFTDEMLEKVKAAGDKKKKFLARDRNVITAMLGKGPDPKEFDDFIAVAKAMPVFKEVIARIKEARLCYDLALACGYNWRNFDTRRFENGSVGWRVQDHDTLLEEILTKAAEAMKSLKRASVDVNTAEIEKFFERFQLAYYLSWAKSLSQRVAENQNYGLLDDVIKYTGECEKQYRKLGASEHEIARIKGYVVNGQQASVPPELDAFIEKLEQQYTNFHNVLRARTGVDKPKPS